MANYAIILAAGDGKRLGSKTPKCFIEINKKPIYQYALELFAIFSQIKKVVLVAPKQYIKSIVNTNPKIKIISGGNDRNKSFECGMAALKGLKNNDKIIIHDGARINVQPEDIFKVLHSNLPYGTMCYIGKQNHSDLRLNNFNIQTPQFCNYFVYKNAKHINKNGKDLFTYLNLKPTKQAFIISTNKEANFKITNKKDLERAKSLSFLN